MLHPIDRPLPQVATALRTGETSARELLREALRRHDTHQPALDAYLLVDREGAAAAAAVADERLARDPSPPPFCGIPISVKDLYGMNDLPVYAGTARRLPESWSRDGWLVALLRAQGAVFVGRTHTVELAFGAVGVNPHWSTPRNPWDDTTHRIPGGSSAGAGVSLIEGSALIALGTDTGGSIRIPASMTGTVGIKTTKGRWPTTGVVPLSTTLDTVGSLSRSALDGSWFFGAVDPAWGDPEAFLRATDLGPSRPVRIGRPEGAIHRACQPDIANVLETALARLDAAPGWSVTSIDGGLLDEAVRLYLHGGIAAAECRAFLERDLPGWIDILDPLVGERLRGAAALDSVTYRSDLARREALASRAPSLFGRVDVLALPGHLSTPAAVDQVEELDRYLDVNRAALTPTCGVNALGLCALTLPVGLDSAGLPVGLQLVASAGADEMLLAVARRAEAILSPLRPTPG
jgi:aspartyl-tRNA(Asn)/glutamyl-tRNA(Gln) amidotransferase subunit A